MAGRKEQLFFIGMLVLVGLLSWLRLSDGHSRQRAPSAKTPETASITLPAEIRVDGHGAGAAAGRDRSVFAPPRELLPMDPLNLPDPPFPPTSVRRPSVRPGLQGPAARTYRVRPEDLGSLSLEGDLEGLGDSETAEPATGGAESDEDAVDIAEQILEERFDWVVRVGSSRRLYGHIVNDDPHGLRSRSGEDIVLQQVSERHGGPLGLPFTLARTDVERFGLAATFANSYFFRTRELGTGPGSAAPRRALAEEMFEAWPEEPQALEFALAEARKAAEASPRDPATSRLLASILRRTHDVEGELAVYREAIDGGWADAALYAGHALLMAERGLPGRAWELVEQGRLAGRSAAELRYVEGLLLRDEGRYAEAAAVLQVAAQVPLLNPFDDHEVVLALGEMLVATDRAEDAAREATRILLEDPRHVGAHALAGAAQAALGDLEAAATSFNEALAGASDDSVILSNAGVVAWRLGDGAAARRFFERARDVNPFRAVEPTLALGFLHEDAGQHEVARELYAEALVLEPGHPDALYRLGRNQRLDGDPAGAVSTLRRALRLAGPDTLLLAELGRASVDRGRYENARRYLREAERLEPDNGEVQWDLGLAALSAGDVLAAQDHLRRAVTLGEVGAHTGLGVAAYQRGDEEAALDHFDEVAKAFAGQSDDPQAVYAAEQAERVRINLSKRQWLDRFGRSAVQRGWIEHQWDGSPRAFLDEGRLHVEGRMEKPREDERPGISRSVEGRGFYAAEAEMAAGDAGETRYGLSLTHRQVRGSRGRLPKARLDIYVDPDGRVRTSVLDNFDTVLRDGELVAGVSVTRGQPVLLGIERLDDVKGTFIFLVDGQPVGEVVSVKALRSFKQTFDLAVYAEAAPGSRASASVALVRIVQAP